MEKLFHDRTRAARFALPVIAVALACGLHACRDATVPTALSPSSPLRWLNPTGVITVLPDSMRGWGFYNDQNSSACTDTSACALVQGPASSPLGAGSAELATTTATDGKALILADYQGTRLDHITTLTYSTYRQSADAGNNLAIALQINADFDLTDASVGYQGRLVFEPYQGNSGAVVRNSWQTWDARSGKWWSTKATVPRGGVNVANPCVQATPCTWHQLLAAFPDVGIHATYGAVIFKAGSGWSAFRGNLDNFTIGIDGVNTTFDFELSRKSIGLSYQCGRRFRVTNRTASGLTLTWRVSGTTDSAIVNVPAKEPDSTSAFADFTTGLTGMTIISLNGVAVDSAANAGLACAGYRLTVIADDGVVFGTSMPRDTVLTPGAVVPFSISPAAGRGTLLAVLDDTLAAFSGSIVMDRDHVFQAETEAPIVPSATVSDLADRIRAVHASNAPQQALLDFMDWARVRIAQVGPNAMNAQLDTAAFFLSDTGADAAALRQFEERVGGTEFLFYPLSNGGTGSYYMTPEDYGYTPGLSALRAPNAARLKSARDSKMRLSALRKGYSALLPGEPRPSASSIDLEPDEATHVIYVNGIFATRDPRTPDAGSASGSMVNLANMMMATSRFGDGGYLRPNVMVSYFLNRSINEDINAWMALNRCEATYYHGLRILRPLHSLYRFAACKAVPKILFWSVLNDLVESGRQFVQIQTGVTGIIEDSRRLAFTIAGHHTWPANVILVGHSQGNLLISQALSTLPSIDALPTNVGDNGCTAVLTLASPIARSSFPNIDQHYVRGLTVKGDILTESGLPNDFDVIHTPAGDAVDGLTGWNRKAQAIKAHFVDENYLLYEPSAARVMNELIALSDECSAGSFTISPNPITVPFGTLLPITPTILNRAGRPLLGRKFNGGPLGLNITTDSIATAYLPTHGVVTGHVYLQNTLKVFATIQANVPDPAYSLPLTITKNSWWVTTFFSGKLGATVDKDQPNWDGHSPCYIARTFSNDSVVESVERHCSLTATANIDWASYPGIRTISVVPVSGGGGSAVARPPSGGSPGAVLISCSDACLEGGYVVEYRNNFNQLVLSQTVTDASFSRMPLTTPLSLRQQNPLGAIGVNGNLPILRSSIKTPSRQRTTNAGGAP